MDVRHISLFKLLLESNGITTSQKISTALNISVRTVKTYIREINTSYPGLIVSSPKGYRINYQLATTVLKETRSSIPQTARERAIYILTKVIKSNSPISSFDLCEELFISYSSFRNLIPRIRQMLSPYELQFELKSDYITVNGTERNKRRFLSNILHQEYSENFFDFDIIQKVYSNIDVLYIRNVITSELKKNNYFINDFSLINLVLHIVIILDRINNNFFDTIHLYTEYLQSVPREHKIATDIISSLEAHFNITFSETDKDEIAFLFISRIKSLDYTTSTLQELNEIIGPECFALVQKMLNYLSDYYDIVIDDTEFIIRFSLHVRNLLIRSEHKQYNINPLTENIKVNCPLIYENSVALANFIKDIKGVTISDDEIAYIAFHVGSALENIRKISSTISCIIYCPTYYDEELHFSQKLLQQFDSDIIVTRIISEEDELFLCPPSDLIITAVPFNLLSSTPIVQVQPFLTEKSIDMIRKKIEDIKLQKKLCQFEENIKELIQPELFECSSATHTKESILRFICDKIETLGYVNESYFDDVMKRESLSSTGYDNFAIPHSMVMNAKKTGIFVYISKSPICWDKKHNVHLIILLFFNKSQREIFNRIFEPLTCILSDNSNVQKLIGADNYNDFISILCNCI